MRERDLVLQERESQDDRPAIEQVAGE